MGGQTRSCLHLMHHVFFIVCSRQKKQKVWVGSNLPHFLPCCFYCAVYLFALFHQQNACNSLEFFKVVQI